MLGVVAIPAGLETFEWQTCSNPYHPEGKRPHREPSAIQHLDDPATLVRLSINNPHEPQLTSQTLQESTLENVLDDSLRRGSSLEDVIEFDRQLIANAKGLEEIPLGESQGTEAPSSPVDELDLQMMLSDSMTQREEDFPPTVNAEAKQTGFLGSVVRKFSKDDQTVSGKVDIPEAKSRSNMTTSSLGLPSSAGGSNPKFELPKPRKLFTLKRKTTRSKSKKSKMSRQDDDDDDEVENGTQGQDTQEPPP